MAGVDKIITFSLSLQAPVALALNFDVAALIAATPRESSWATSELSRVYSDDTLDGDFAASTTPRRLAARFFAQAEAGRPRRIQVIRLTSAPSQVWDVGVNGSALSSTDYAFMLEGEDSSGDPFSEEVAITSDGSATIAEIVTALAAAVTALSISGVTAAAAASNTVCRVTGAAGTCVNIALEDASGKGYGPYNLTNNLLTLTVAAADPSTAIADQLAAAVLQVPGFYGLLNPYQGKAFASAAALWTESNKRLLLQLDSDTATATSVLSGATDFAAAMKLAAYLRTIVLHHHRPHEAADAAWFGNRLPAVPGTEDWMMSTLAGCTPTPLTTTHNTNIEARNANWYGYIGADGNTWEGKVAGGYFIDYIRFRDRVEARCNEGIYNLHKSLAVRAKKVPGNDTGLLMGRGALVEVLDQMVKDGSLSSFDVSTPRQVDRSSADKATRNVSGVVIRAVSSSSIHHWDVEGVLAQ